MLTSDLVRATKKKGRLFPRYLAEKDRRRLAPVADALVATYRSMVGATRGELDEALAAIPYGARDRALVLALRKLCDDRTELEQESPIDPETARAAAFAVAARAHRAGVFDRAAALAEAERELGAPPGAVERALFADLRDAQVVRSFTGSTGEALLAGYDLALTQALLLRATKVTVTFEEPRPSALRDLFRAARFHGLCHVVERRGGSGYRVTLDGPFSLFESVQKYGLRLALFLPYALALAKFEIVAEIAWGPSRERVELVLSDGDGLARERLPASFARPEVEALKSAFSSLASPWGVEDNDRVLVAKDGVAVIPDLVFSNRETGEEVFLEVFGFWSRASVWRRIEQIEAGLPARLILAVSKGARVSEAALDEGEGGSCLVVFRSAISAKEILARLEACQRG